MALYKSKPGFGAWKAQCSYSQIAGVVYNQRLKGSSNEPVISPLYMRIVLGGMAVDIPVRNVGLQSLF